MCRSAQQVVCILPGLQAAVPGMPTCWRTPSARSISSPARKATFPPEVVYASGSRPDRLGADARLEHLRLQHPDKGQIPVALMVIQPVTHDKLVGDVKTPKGDREVDDPPS